ncbi:MAG: dihydroorotate dehydrogenase-like protein, partial [Acidimicrobiales bacterium]
MNAAEPTVDLTTTYLGLELASPIVASAGPLTGDIDDLIQLERAGVGAVVLPSLFEEQIGAGGPDDHLDLVERAVGTLDIPIIASLNGTTTGGWTSFAALMHDAGAAAIELNIYHVAADALVRGAEIEDHYVHLVSEVRAVVDLPLAVKVGPQFSSMANMAQRLVASGADGLVLFNRFYQPEINLDDLTVKPHLALSDPAELRFVLQWMAILRSQLSCSLGATTGIHSGQDVVKCLLAGADVAMTTSSLLMNGPGHVAKLLADTAAWLTERGYESSDQARGTMSQDSVPNPDAFERAN